MASKLRWNIRRRSRSKISAEENEYASNAIRSQYCKCRAPGTGSGGEIVSGCTAREENKENQEVQGAAGCRGPHHSAGGQGGGSFREFLPRPPRTVQSR